MSRLCQQNVVERLGSSTACRMLARRRWPTLGAFDGHLASGFTMSKAAHPRPEFPVVRVR